MGTLIENARKVLAVYESSVEDKGNHADVQAFQTELGLNGKKNASARTNLKKRINEFAAKDGLSEDEKVLGLLWAVKNSFLRKSKAGMLDEAILEMEKKITGPSTLESVGSSVVNSPVTKVAKSVLSSVGSALGNGALKVFDTAVSSAVGISVDDFDFDAEERQQRLEAALDEAKGSESNSNVELENTLRQEALDAAIEASKKTDARLLELQKADDAAERKAKEEAERKANSIREANSFEFNMNLFNFKSIASKCAVILAGTAIVAGLAYDYRNGFKHSSAAIENAKDGVRFVWNTQAAESVKGVFASSLSFIKSHTPDAVKSFCSKIAEQGSEFVSRVR